MLSYTGWLNGISATVLVIFGCIFGMFLIIQSKKLKVNLLLFMGMMMLCAGLIWLGVCVDFLTVLITERNLDNSYGLISILNFMWLAPGIIFGMYVWAELMMPEKKHYFIIIYLILGILYIILIFLDQNSFTYLSPVNPGEDLIDSSIVLASPVGVLSVVFALSNLVFLGFGFLFKTFRSKGVLRKKFLFLSIGEYLLLIFGALDAFTTPGATLILVRIGVLISLWFFYLGLREEPDKPKRIEKKEVKIEESLFRLSRPENLTENEVTFHRELKICLVCKNRLSRAIYLCPACNALYCEKCSQSLSDAENACWVCNEPFDDSKPSSPFEGIESKVNKKGTKKKEKPKGTQKSPTDEIVKL